MGTIKLEMQPAVRAPRLDLRKSRLALRCGTIDPAGRRDLSIRIWTGLLQTRRELQE